MQRPINMFNTLYTGGTFDIFHYGHVRFLKRCSFLAKEVVVSLNTDEFIREFKGFAPIMSYEERKEALENCPYVSKVIKNVGNQDSKPAILQVKPDILAIGTDWVDKDYYKQMNFTQEWLDKNKISLVYLPYTDVISTTKIKQRILEIEGTPCY